MVLFKSQSKGELFRKSLNTSLKGRIRSFTHMVTAYHFMKDLKNNTWIQLCTA